MARVAVAPGVALEYEEAGSGGPPFLFVHGLACDLSAWAPQVAALSAKHRCVNVNLRGRGASDAVPPYGIVQQAEDLAALSRALDLGAAIVVGHSLGGLAALVLNDRYPELVLGIVAGDSPINAEGLRGGALADAITASGSTAPLGPLLDVFWGPESTPQLQEYVRTMMFGCPPAVVAGMLADDPGPAGMKRMVLAADRKPFMALWAERPIAAASWLRDICMFVRQEVIAGTGHFFQIERPDVTNALLLAFVDDVARDPRLEKLGLR